MAFDVLCALTSSDLDSRVRLNTLELHTAVEGGMEHISELYNETGVCRAIALQRVPFTHLNAQLLTTALDNLLKAILM